MLGAGLLVGCLVAALGLLTARLLAARPRAAASREPLCALEERFRGRDVIWDVAVTLVVCFA